MTDIAEDNKLKNLSVSTLTESDQKLLDAFVRIINEADELDLDRKEYAKIRVHKFNFYYDQLQAVKDVTMDIFANRVTSIIGPSGCGKSTFLRCLNRMNDVIAGVRWDGQILMDDQSILDRNRDVISLRCKVGMVFQKPNPFPQSIFDNVAFGLRINGIKDKYKVTEKVEKSLKDAALWDEVKDRLFDSAFSLSGGQQQRLCVARALAVEPEVLLMDEPASALDPIATAKIEELIKRLKEKYTIIIVTHSMQQAARISNMTAFFMNGELIEYGKTKNIFTRPKQRTTENYISGKFG
jgi:phosphate transport system ATP-binding protein